MSAETDGIVLAHLTGLKTQLDRLEDKVDHKADKDDVNRLEGKVDYTNGSVRELQLWRAQLAGAASALSWRPTVAIGGFLTVVTAFATAAATHFIG